MHKGMAWVLGLALLAGCAAEGDGKGEAGKGDKAGGAPCDIDLEHLKGAYVWAMGTGSQLKPQWLFRASFNEEGGKERAVLLMGAATFNRVVLYGEKQADGSFHYLEKPVYEGEKFEEYKKTNENPNNRYQVRAKVEKDYACRLVMRDGWDYYDKGQVKWKQSDLGSKTMMPIPADREYSFEIATEKIRMFDAAKEYKAAKAEGDEYQQYVVEWTREDVAVWSPLTDKKDGCTYSIDLYRDDRPLLQGPEKKPVKDAPVQVEEKEGMLRWPFNIEFTYAGIGTLEMRRYRTCDGQKERLAVADAVIDVEQSLKDSDDPAIKDKKGKK